MKLFLKVSLALLIAATCTNAPVWARQKNNMEKPLSSKQQSMVIIAAFTVKGDLTTLKTKLNSGLDAGLTVNEIKEVIVHLYAYCGFPRSIRGLQTLMTVLEERKAKGINDQPGPTASPVKDDRSKYERGKTILGELTGAPQDGPKTGYAAFAPEIEIFLKEHLFADIFERDVLSYADRELVTIAVLSSIGGAEPMLNSHMNICLNVGLTSQQLQQFISIIKSKIGATAGNSAQSVLNHVLKNKK
jgi:4-carboxymuconolactone decarboxylase